MKPVESHAMDDDVSLSTRIVRPPFPFQKLLAGYRKFFPFPDPERLSVENQRSPEIADLRGCRRRISTGLRPPFPTVPREF